MNMKLLVLAIDFDGTICQSHWPQCGDPIPGAVETIQKLHKRGHKVIIHTCRTGKPLDDAVHWLLRHNVPYDAINANLPLRIKAFGSDTRKISADLYIDDKNVFCGKVDATYWMQVYRAVNRKSMEGYACRQ